jgi:anaerobic selenocysteine-containing dehydrogenase
MDLPLVKRTACSRDCPDACEILATVEDGRITRLRGAPDHPVTAGFLCERTSRYLERQYARERLTEPLLRSGRDWVPIGWDEAIDRIAAKIGQVRAESGTAAIMHYRCGGSLGLMKHVSDWFFQRLGPITAKSGDICSGAGEAAQETDFGVSDSHDIFDLQNSRTIVLWGKNVYVSNVHLLPVLKRAREAGAKLVLIDPIRHRTAQLCDLVLQPRPGGDAALACGVALWLLEHSRHDATALSYCDHWDDYHALIRSRTLTQWAQAAGVAVSELCQLAQQYSQGPSAILVGWGMQRRRHGSATVRTLDALAAMSGNLGVAGGGVSFYYKRRGAFDLSFQDNAPPAARSIPEPLLGQGILEANDPPIRFLWITAANPVAMLPDSRRVAAALSSREMTVVVDAFMTDTAQCAHLVLPTTTFLEEDDLVGAYGHHWVAELRAVVPPLGQARSDYAIVQQLATRLGMAELFDADITTWKRRLLRKAAGAGVTLEALRGGAVRNPFASQVLFADRKFATPTQRVNLITALSEELTQPAASDQLRLAPLSCAATQGSQWSPAQQMGLPKLRVHPDAIAGARHGQVAELRSELGSMHVELELDAGVHGQLAVMDKGGWLHADRCANALIPAELTDQGEGAVYYDTPVVVRLLS